jgi:hypothetical protein
MPSKSITFRVPTEVKSNLESKAKSQSVSLSTLLNKLSVDYFPLEKEKERLRSIEQDMVKMNKELGDARTEKAFYEHSKLDYHFKTLHGKKVGGRIIETKNDLFQVMLNQFDYHFEDGNVKLMDTSVEVKEGYKLSVVDILLFFATILLGVMAWKDNKRWKGSKRKALSTN